MQEQMVESEEHFANLLHEEHQRLEACQTQFSSAVQTLEARLREAALREEHLLSQLHAAKKVNDPHQVIMKYHDTIFDAQ